MRIGLALILALVVASRLYAWGLGVRFDASAAQVNLQFIDPELLRTRLLESLYYLRDQPPLLNALVGVVLKAAPGAYSSMLGALYFGLGLLTAAGLYHLLVALRFGAWPAALLTTLYALHPTTILYENWLMYEAPLCALLVAGAWLLHAYVASSRTGVGLALFFVLALVVLTRGTFHLLWLLCLVPVVALFMRSQRRLVLAAAAGPVALAALPYVKNAVVFGTALTGDVYRGINYASMITPRLSLDERRRFLEQGVLSRAATLDFYNQPVTAYSDLLPPIKETGVPLLDRPRKSTGAVNWHHQAMPLVADLYYQDARRVAALRPGLYWESVAENVKRYALPAGDTRPFSVPDYGNGAALRGWTKPADLIFAGQLERDAPGWLLALFLPLVFAYAFGGSIPCVWRGVRRRAIDRWDAARDAVLVYCAFNVLYVAFTTIALSYADHNRYRFATTPLVLVLAALMARNAWAFRGGRRARPNGGVGRQGGHRRERRQARRPA